MTPKYKIRCVPVLKTPTLGTGSEITFLASPVIATGASHWSIFKHTRHIDQSHKHTHRSKILISEK